MLRSAIWDASSAASCHFSEESDFSAHVSLTCLVPLAWLHCPANHDGCYFDFLYHCFPFIPSKRITRQPLFYHWPPMALKLQSKERKIKTILSAIGENWHLRSGTRLLIANTFFCCCCSFVFGSHLAALGLLLAPLRSRSWQTRGPCGMPGFEPGSALCGPRARQTPYSCAIAPAQLLILDALWFCRPRALKTHKPGSKSYNTTEFL